MGKLATRRWIKPGNSKLGALIGSWSLPAVRTCPGATEVCLAHCYARRGHYSWPSNQRALAAALRLAKSPRLVSVLSREILRQGYLAVRIHTSGDFFSPEYVDAWSQIVDRCRRTQFFAYTRSWRFQSPPFQSPPDKVVGSNATGQPSTAGSGVNQWAEPEMLEALSRFSGRRNAHLWLSIDHDTDRPPRIRRARVAYMSVGPDDIPPGITDLVFRTDRRGVQKYRGGRLVCPPENGITDMTCSQCRLCWTRRRPPRKS